MDDLDVLTRLLESVANEAIASDRYPWDAAGDARRNRERAQGSVRDSLARIRAVVEAADAYLAADNAQPPDPIRASRARIAMVLALDFLTDDDERLLDMDQEVDQDASSPNTVSTSRSES